MLAAGLYVFHRRRIWTLKLCVVTGVRVRVVYCVCVCEVWCVPLAYKPAAEKPVGLLTIPGSIHMERWRYLLWPSMELLSSAGTQPKNKYTIDHVQHIMIECKWIEYGKLIVPSVCDLRLLYQQRLYQQP